MNLGDALNRVARVERENALLREQLRILQGGKPFVVPDIQRLDVVNGDLVPSEHGKIVRYDSHIVQFSVALHAYFCALEGYAERLAGGQRTWS